MTLQIKALMAKSIKTTFFHISNNLRPMCRRVEVIVGSINTIIEEIKLTETSEPVMLQKDIKIACQHTERDKNKGGKM